MAEDTGQNELEKFRTNECIVKTCEKSVDYSNEKWRIIVEPAVVGAMAAITLGQTTLQNFYLRTACMVDLQLPRNICESGVGPEFKSAEQDAQAIIAGFNVSRSFVGALISTIVLLFAGPWSDCSGRRKPLLVMPLLGMSIMTFAVILMVTFPGMSAVQVLYVVQIPMSVGGNFGLLLAAAFSYIGDVCHAEGRDVTRAMGTHRAVIQVAHVAGAVSGPLLYRHFGFYGVFPIVLFLQVSSLIFVIFRVKDTSVNHDNKVSPLNWRLPLTAVKCLLRKRNGQRRKIVLLMLFVTMGDRMLLAADVLLSFFYYRRKFNFDDILFGSFLAYKNIVNFVGTLLILTVLKRRLHLSDELVGALSCLSFACASCSLIAATSTFLVFLVAIVGIIGQGSQVVQRPIVNKQISPNEQGKIYSVMGALEQACQTIFSPLYSLLYANTVKVAPDAWLIPGIVIAVFQIGSYLLARKLSYSSTKNKTFIAETEALNAKISEKQLSTELTTYRISDGKKDLRSEEYKDNENKSGTDRNNEDTYLTETTDGNNGDTGLTDNNKK